MSIELYHQQDQDPHLHHDVFILHSSPSHVAHLFSCVLDNTNWSVAHLLRTLKLILLLASDESLELLHVRDILRRHLLTVRLE